jgi:hypothetical protein
MSPTQEAEIRYIHRQPDHGITQVFRYLSLLVRDAVQLIDDEQFHLREHLGVVVVGDLKMDSCFIMYSERSVRETNCLHNGAGTFCGIARL